MTHGAASKQFIRGAEGAAQGVRVGASAVLVAEQLPETHPQKQISENSSRTYSNAYGGEISLFAANGYDACLIVRDAMMRADPPEPARLRDAIEGNQRIESDARRV